MRIRLIGAAVGIGLLGGCVADQPAPIITLNGPMRLPIDYYPRPVLHPVPQRQSGPVVPVDNAPGLERNFGPQSRLHLSPDTIASLLEDARAHRDSDPSQWLALAKPRSSHAAKAVSAAAPESQTELDDPFESDDRQSAKDKDRQDGYRLNFEDADVKDVLQAVLGKVLGLNYTIAPNVIGRITISSASPQNRDELLSTMETVLAGQGLSLTKIGNLYRVAPIAPGGGTMDKTGTSPGFGTSVVPVLYTSVTSMMKLLSGFVVDADGLRLDTAQNAIIVRGPGPRREEIVRAIKAFDGDWMHKQSVSVVELRRSRPDELIGELSRIFNVDPSADANGVIQFKAIKRLRSIMVISNNERLVRRATAWIHRLDHQDLSSTDSIFIYRPRYRDAKELAKMVNSVFGQDQGSDSSADASAQSSKDQAATGQSSQSIGMSSASFAGGLNTQGSGSGAPGGVGLSITAPGGGGGAQASGKGLSGALADPIEASKSGSGSQLHLTLKADASNNTIVAYTNGDTYKKVVSVLHQLDLPPLQVAVSVIVAEVQLNDELKYGIQFYLNNKRGSIGLSETASSILATKTGFNFLLNGATSPEVVISALDSISKVHILSTPSIVVMENKPATFEVGNQVPVVTQQATSTLTTGAPTLNQVQYLDTGIILKITPRVGQNGDVAMQLDQVISSVVPDPSGQSSLTPTISKRRIASDITVRSGQSVLLAGLINDTRSQTKAQIPFLGGVSDLLGNKDNAFARNELVVFIRPVIIRDGKDAGSVVEDFKTHLKALDVVPPPVYKP